MQHEQRRGNLYQVNPHLFFFLQDGEFVVWDYHHHKQWVVTRSYINALEKIANHKSVSLSLMKDLLKAKMVTRQAPTDLSWGWDIVSKIYHMSCSNIFSDRKKSRDTFTREYTNTCKSLKANHQEPVFCQYVFEPKFSPSLTSTSLATAIENRKTTRCFDGSPIAYETLGQLLYTSCGEIHKDWPDLENSGYNIPSRRRSFPSGGGLYPIRYFVLVINVDSIQPGIYEYHPSANGLRRVKSIVKEGIYSHLTDCLNAQFFCEGIAAGLLFIPDFPKEWEKYPHSRSYRDVFLDIGHCSQNILLTATAMKMRTWITAAFKDEKLRAFLGIEEPYTYPVEFIGLGYGENHSLPKEFR